MAYSRFSNSVWYTFWTATSPRGIFKKKDQLFEICDAHSYYVTYREIVKDIDQVLSDVKKFYSEDRPGKIFDHVDAETNKFVYVDWVYPAKNPTNEELEELRGYMLAFVQDVDEHFMPLNYAKYEWYYPVRNELVKWMSSAKKLWKRVVGN
jgi:hypothetical protein